MKASTLRSVLAAVLLAAALMPRAAAQDAGPAPPAVDAAKPGLREEAHSITVTVKDLFGREETKQIPVTVFRPDGPGPFPLVIMNHGRAPADRRAEQRPQRFEALSQHLVGKGFVVVLPTRVGYGPTYGDFDPESTGPCATMQLEAQSKAASDQVLAALAFAKALAYVDASRWIVAGQSVGGLTAVATVWRHPAGLVGGINFSGGTGGDPHRSPGRSCHPERIGAFWEAHAAEAVAPMLWLYWENDEYWGAEAPRRWHAAWVTGGGKAEFHQLAAVRKTGHAGVVFDIDHWAPYVDGFLTGLGFGAPGAAVRPP